MKATSPTKLWNGIQSRLRRLAWVNHLDKELRHIGWGRGSFLQAYYRGRLHEHLPGNNQVPVKMYKVTQRSTNEHAKLYLRSDPVGGDWLILRGVWLYEDYMHANIRRCRRILDVGANIGQAAIWFSKLAAQAEIACVEADPRNVPLLKKNLKLNAIHARVFAEAAADRCDSLELAVGGDTGWSSLAQYNIHGHANTISVRSRRIPDFLDELGWDRVDLLKLDIEGAEEEILKGSADWLHRVGAIALELHNNMTVEEVARCLGVAWRIERMGCTEEATYYCTRHVLRPG